MISYYFVYKLDIVNPSKDVWKAFGLRINSNITDFYSWYSTPEDSISELLQYLIKEGRKDILLYKNLYYTENCKKDFGYR